MHAETKAASAAADAPTPAAEAGPQEAISGMGDALHALWEDARGAVTDRVRLLLLELRLAGVTLVQLVVYAVVVAVLVVTAWLALVGGLVAGFMSFGLHWAMAVAIVIVVNLAVAAWIVVAMLRMVERIGLPVSLRRFGKPAGAAATPSTPKEA
ncbi:MAG: hypothetical protein AB1430_17400 [Pseudomonadota bacterium]